MKDEIILESIEKYQTKEAVVRHLIENNALVREAAHLGSCVQNSVANQLVDYIWQGGSESISEALFNKMQQSAIIEQALTLRMQPQICKILQEDSVGLNLSKSQTEIDIAASTSLAASKIRDCVHNNIMSDSSDCSRFYEPPAVRHENAICEPCDNKINNIIDQKEQQQILQQTIDSIHKAQAKLRIQLKIQHEQHLQQVRLGMDLKF